MMPRRKQAGEPKPAPAPHWLAGAFIGLTILGMASTAMAVGAGLALGGSRGGK